MLDVSESGVRLIITQPLDVTSEVEITVDGYGLKGSIKRLGIVRWLMKLDNGQFCVGVEFQKCINYGDWQTLATPS